MADKYFSNLNGYKVKDKIAHERLDALEQYDAENRLLKLEEWVANKDYVKIAANLYINSNTSTSVIKEIGDTLANATLNWKVTKDAISINLTLPNGDKKAQTIGRNGSYTDTNTYQAHEVDGEGNVIKYSYPCTKTWTLSATEADAKAGSTTANAYLYFRHRVYWGIGTVAMGFTSDFVKALADDDTQNKHSELSTSKSKTFTVFADSKKYVYYAVPKDLCTSDPSFYVDGSLLSGGFSYKEDVEVTNSYGVKIIYCVYRSDHQLSGSTKVEAK